MRESENNTKNCYHSSLVFIYSLLSSHYTLVDNNWYFSFSLLTPTYSCAKTPLLLYCSFKIASWNPFVMTLSTFVSGCCRWSPASHLQICMQSVPFKKACFLCLFFASSFPFREFWHWRWQVSVGWRRRRRRCWRENNLWLPVGEGRLLSARRLSAFSWGRRIKITATAVPLRR